MYVTIKLLIGLYWPSLLNLCCLQCTSCCLNAAWSGGSVEYYRGPRHALTWLYRHYGIPGVYRGYTIFVIRDVPASGIYIAVYEFLYDYLYATRSVIFIVYTAVCPRPCSVAVLD